MALKDWPLQFLYQVGSQPSGLHCWLVLKAVAFSQIFVLKIVWARELSFYTLHMIFILGLLGWGFSSLRLPWSSFDTLRTGCLIQAINFFIDSIRYRIILMNFNLVNVPFGKITGWSGIKFWLLKVKFQKCWPPPEFPSWFSGSIDCKK